MGGNFNNISIEDLHNPGKELKKGPFSVKKRVRALKVSIFPAIERYALIIHFIQKCRGL